MCFLSPSPLAGPFGIFGETCDFCRNRSPIIFLPPVSSWMVRKCFAALCSSSALFEACSCLLHPGENRLDRNKMKSPRMTLCQPLGTTLIYSSSSYFHVLFTSFQTLRTMPPANILLWTVKLFTHIFFFAPFFGFLEMVAVIRIAKISPHSTQLWGFYWKFHSLRTSPIIHTSLCSHRVANVPSRLLKSSENLTEWLMNPFRFLLPIMETLPAGGSLRFQDWYLTLPSCTK